MAAACRAGRGRQRTRRRITYGAMHHVVFVVVTEPLLVRACAGHVEAFTRQQLHHRRNSIHGHDRDLPHRIDRDASPVRSTDVRGQHQRALEARRREDAFVAQAADHCAARLAVGLRYSPHLICRQTMRAERRGHGRERLRAGRLFTRDIAGRDRPFLDREQRHARFTVARTAFRLGRLNDRRDRFAVVRERHERRRRSIVVVPEIVMDGLECPDDRAGRRFQRDQRIRVPVVTEPEAAIVVGCRTSGRDEHGLRSASPARPTTHSPHRFSRARPVHASRRRRGPSSPGDRDPRTT